MGSSQSSQGTKNACLFWGQKICDAGLDCYKPQSEELSEPQFRSLDSGGPVSINEALRLNGRMLEKLGDNELDSELRRLQMRRIIEQSLIKQADKTYVDAEEDWYLIDSLWLREWREFAIEGSMVRPGPISNDRLLDSNGRVRSDLVKALDYRGINKKTWELFYNLYNGGPAITAPEIDIYKATIEPTPTTQVSGRRSSRRLSSPGPVPRPSNTQPSTVIGA